MKNKKCMLIFMLILSAVLVLSGCSNKKEGLAAIVNNIEITDEEFNEDFQVYKNLYERQLGEDALSQVGMDGKTLGEGLRESILEKLIMEKLIQEDSQVKGIQLSDKELTEKINEYIDTMGGNENYQEFLETNNLSEEYFRENMRKELVVGKHKENFISGLEIAETDSIKYFEENSSDLFEAKASHILLSTEEDASRVLQSIKDGSNFEQLATLESLDSISAVKGGDLGYFSKGEMITEFEDIAFSLEEGEISDIVKTEVGYHIIKLVDRLDTFEELKEKVEFDLKENQYYDYIETLRTEAKIKKYLD